MNAVFSKFIKRYLNIPFTSNNNITYFVTSSIPLDAQLIHVKERAKYALSRQLSSTLPGYTFNFLKTKDNIAIDKTSYISDWIATQVIPNIPSYFWKSKVIINIPSKQNTRKTLCGEVYDLSHFKFCSNKTFHMVSNILGCMCEHCEEPLEHYHMSFGCDPFKNSHVLTSFGNKEEILDKIHVV